NPMDREEAKSFLELCRPGVEADHTDPLIAEALAMLDQDPELRASFESGQVIDARISESLNSIEPPASLKAEILAGMYAHKASADEKAPATSADMIAFPEQTSTKNWMSAFVGLAAVFVALFVTFAALRTGQETNTETAVATAGIPDLVQFLSAEMSNMKGLDKRSQQSGPIMTYLASQGAPRPDALKEVIRDKRTLGCVVFDYNGAKLSMICFKDDSYYHIATLDKADITEEIPQDPAFYQIGKQTFKLWQDEKQVHILTMEGTEEDLPELI
ncbi:MAG: hypothetical protein AAF546_12320, partial [Verrucomicrobiota bacterium]